MVGVLGAGGGGDGHGYQGGKQDEADQDAFGAVAWAQQRVGAGVQPP
jgi:hypothetical protein